MSMMPTSIAGSYKPLGDQAAKKPDPLPTLPGSFEQALQSAGSRQPAAQARAEAAPPVGSLSPQMQELITRAQMTSPAPYNTRQDGAASGMRNGLGDTRDVADESANSVRRPVDKTVYGLPYSKTENPETSKAQPAPSEPAAKQGKVSHRRQKAQMAAATHRYDTLSSTFESGHKGVEAIGYDHKGGTSYGKYQISSRSGTLENFLKFLDAKAPDMSSRLRAAGHADTGGKVGSMPEEWRKVASENPKRFESLQHEFILRSHYLPALKTIAQETGVNVAEHSPALKEVLWSTAVQHGPNRAARIFSQAIGQVDHASAASDRTSPDFDRGLISEIYKGRQKLFATSSSAMRTAMHTRFKREENSAMSMHNSQTKEPVSII